MKSEGRSERASMRKEVDMKKIICLVIALVLVPVLAISFSEYAYAAGGGSHGGGGHGGGSWQGGGGGNWHGGGGNWHGGGWHGGHWSGNIWIGPGWGWGPWWWGPGYPYYPYYSYYPYYASPGAVEQQPIYTEEAPQRHRQSYWYYCEDSRAYYPYVKQCPKGWMKVVPSPVPEDREE